MTLTAASIDRYYPRVSATTRSGIILGASLDHALAHLAAQGVFSLCALTLKGGTAAHKFRVGARGRLSLDLDFDGEPGSDAIVAETLHGASLGGFGFSISERRGRYTLRCETPLGASCAAKLDFSGRTPWLPTESRPFLPQPLHTEYTADAVRPLPEIPVCAVDETIAEKLCRWQNEPLIRDLYDLVALRGLLRSPEDVATMWVLKAHMAMHEPMSRHPKQAAAASAERVLASRGVDGFNLDDLVLARPAAGAEKREMVAGWLRALPMLYGFLPEVLSEDLHRIAADTGHLATEARRLAEEFRRTHGTVPQG